MRTRIALVAVALAVLAVVAPAGVLAAGYQPLTKEQRATVKGVHADVSCHDPCDDPFWLKAFVRGSDVAGLKVKFTVKNRAYTARCSSSGYAHYHLDMSPEDYPQGVVVKVKASVSHGGVVKTDSTWFKPNYN